jgi:hypothetical protein
MTRNTMSVDGLEINIFRSLIDGKLCVAIDTCDLQDEDMHKPIENAIPKIRVSINEQDIDT